jgi:hypothetical protein
MNKVLISVLGENLDNTIYFQEYILAFYLLLAPYDTIESLSIR